MSTEAQYYARESIARQIGREFNESRLIRDAGDATKIFLNPIETLGPLTWLNKARLE